MVVGTQLREVSMVDGFYWTRVTSKQLRFLYEPVTELPTPPHMQELAARIDRAVAISETGNDALRNRSSPQSVGNAKEHNE
jgi:hypothetical protein